MYEFFCLLGHLSRDICWFSDLAVIVTLRDSNHVMAMLKDLSSRLKVETVLAIKDDMLPLNSYCNQILSAPQLVPLSFPVTSSIYFTIYIYYLSLPNHVFSKLFPIPQEVYPQLIPFLHPHQAADLRTGCR